MLSKRARLRAEEVREVIAKGSFKRATYMQLRHLGTSEALRSAVVVPKSVARKATDRNTLRRAAYRVLREILPSGLKGRAVFFVKSVPKDDLAPAFKADIVHLLSL